MAPNRFLTIIVLALLSTASAYDRPDAVASVRPQFRFSWAETARTITPEQYDNVRNLLAGPNPMLALYREDVTHDAVVEFFVDLTGSVSTALPILYHADRIGISLSLVFSLAWVESRYRPDAINENATSIDRGLFQLNSRTFTTLTEDDFFHPDINTQHGIEFLAWCLEHTTSEMQAVAVYNAGLTRVRAGQTPASTLIHVERIRTFRAQLIRRFEAFILNEFPSSAT